MDMHWHVHYVKQSLIYFRITFLMLSLKFPPPILEIQLYIKANLFQLKIVNFKMNMFIKVMYGYTNSLNNKKLDFKLIPYRCWKKIEKNWEKIITISLLRESPSSSSPNAFKSSSESQVLNSLESKISLSSI